MGLLIAARAAVKTLSWNRDSIFYFGFQLSLSNANAAPMTSWNGEDGYRANPNAFQEIPKDKLPPRGAKGGNGARDERSSRGTIATRVDEVKDKSVIVDLNLNHPLAGKTLNFNVKVRISKSAKVK